MHPDDDRPLRICIVSRYDVCGGAEVVAQDQWREFSNRGHAVSFIVGKKQSADPAIVQAPTALPDSTKVRWWRETLHGADVVHFHNLHGDYVPWEVLRFASRRSVVAATLHDQFLFTGGCVHTYGCERWTLGCGRCPQRSGSDAPRDDTASQWRRKLWLWSECHLHAVAPARWIYDRARGSILAAGAARIHRIPNGVDTQLFRPRDRAPLRTRFAIPPDRVVLLTAGHRLRTNHSKDWPILEACLWMLRSRLRTPVILLVAGETGHDVDLDGVAVRFLGPIESRRTMAGLYSVADIYVQPSRVETFSLSILEAMASGCAVVATDVGAAEEQLAPASSGAARGVVVRSGDPVALATSLMSLVQNVRRRQQLGASAASHVRLEWTLEGHTSAHLALYRSQQRGTGTRTTGRSPAAKR